MEDSELFFGVGDGARDRDRDHDRDHDLPGGADPSDALPEIEGFRILRRLGSGGMGDVFEAEDLTLRRRVAVKVLRVPVLASRRERAAFRREAEAGARLHHEGIVAIHSIGLDAAVPYLVQELVPGGRTLADRIAERREAGAPDDFVETARMFARIAEALQAAHDADVVHRDVKPRNVLLDAGGRPKIADFGLAKLVTDESMTRTGDFFGTYGYMSPEQAEGPRAGVDPRTDVFSLGATLYECLTLERAFTGDTPHRVLHEVRFVDPPDARKRRRAVPADLARICAKMLEKRPADRYDSMRAVAEDLRRFLDGETVLARPVGPWGRARKWIGRHPVAGTALASLFALAVVIAAFVANLDRERRQREEETSRARGASYRLALRSAQVDLEAGAVERAREALASCPAELRGFEWRLLHASLPVPGRTVARDASPILALARVASNDPVTGVPVEPGSGFASRESGARGYAFAIGREDGRVTLVRLPRVDAPEAAIADVESAERVSDVEVIDLAVLPGTAPGAGEGDPVRALADDRRGARIAAGTASGRVIVYGLGPPIEAAGKGVAASPSILFETWCEASVESVSFGGASTPELLAAGLATGEVLVFDLTTGATVYETELYDRVLGVEPLPDGRTLLIASEHEVDRWTGGQTQAVVVPGRAITAFDLAADGSLFVVGTEVGTVEWFEPLRGRRVGELRGVGAVARAVALSADGTLVAIGREDGRVELVDAASGELLLTPGRHSGPVRGIAFYASGRRLVSVSVDGTVRRFAIEEGVVRLPLARTEALVVAGWEEAASRAAIPGEPDSIEIHALVGADLEVRDATTGEIRRALHADGAWVACARDVAARWSAEGFLEIVDRATGEVTATIAPPEVAEGRAASAGAGDLAVDLTADGSRVGLAGSPDAAGGVFRTSDGRRTHRLGPAVSPESLAGGAPPPPCVALSADGSRIAIGDALGGVAAWRLGPDGEVELLARHESGAGVGAVAGAVAGADSGGGADADADAGASPVSALAFDARARRLASGRADGTIRVLDLERRRERVLRGHVAAVVSLEFLPGERSRDRWVSGSLDGTLRVWDARFGPTGRDAGGADALLVLERRSAAWTLDARVGDGGLLVAGQTGEIDRLDPGLVPEDLVAFRDARARARRLAPRVEEWAQDALAEMVGTPGDDTLEDRLVRRIEDERERASLSPPQLHAAIHLVRQGDMVERALIGLAARELQRIDEAGYEQGVIFGNDATYDFCMLGIGRLLVGNLDAAVASLEIARSRAVEGDPRVGDYYLALALRRLGRVEEADAVLADVREAVAESGDSRLARIYGSLDRMASPEG